MSTVIVDRKNKGITHLRLNRPEKRNALNVELLETLCDHLEKTQQMSDQRVVILSGEGTIFCAGMDLSENQEKGSLIADLFNLLYFSPIVTIAAVQGAALAGGAGMMAACDLVVAHPDCKFGFPEIQKGLVAAQVMTLLVRQISQRPLKELLLLGEMVSAERAFSMGLINRISEDPDKTAVELAKQVMKGAPVATQLTKELLNDFDTSFPEDLHNALSYHEKMIHSEEAKEGILSFLEKRFPSWM